MSRTSIPANLKLGFLGAGQLARMSSLEAFRFGIQVSVFSDRAENEPVQFMTPFSTSGSFDSVDDMVAFAKECDVITLENEFISSEILAEVQEKSGTPIFPSPSSFALIENKLIEKQTFENAGIPVTPYKLVESEEDLEEFGSKHNWPYLLKSSKGGYDGYGNETVRDFESAKKAFDKLGGNKGRDILAEAFVPFTKELAVQVARNETGIAVYPCCETVQENHICIAVLSPAPIQEKFQIRAQELAVKAVEAIDGKGIYAFEFFLTENCEILLNESAPRPHNSGHYTIEGCVTSQFENHVRAVLGLPLGSTKMNVPAVAMINLLGTHNRPAETDHIQKALETENGHLHVYGKVQSKIGRKMAHYTLLGDDLEKTYHTAKELTKKYRDLTMSNPIIGVVMGSDSDWPTMKQATDILDQFEVLYEKRVVSAHRTPNDMADYGETARERGLQIIIAGAGGAAHLPGMLASHTTLPVIGVPIQTSALGGLDSLYSIVQMPNGIPVATVAIGKAQNAGLLALRMLSMTDSGVAEKLEAYHAKLADESREKTDNLI